MPMAPSEQRLLEQLAASPDNDFSADDQAALVEAGVPIFCLLKAAAQLARCGPTKPECLKQFAEAVADCFGA